MRRRTLCGQSHWRCSKTGKGPAPLPGCWPPTATHCSWSGTSRLGPAPIPKPQYSVTPSPLTATHTQESACMHAREHRDSHKHTHTHTHTERERERDLSTIQRPNDARSQPAQSLTMCVHAQTCSPTNVWVLGCTTCQLWTYSCIGRMCTDTRIQLIPLYP